MSNLFEQTSLSSGTRTQCTRLNHWLLTRNNQMRTPIRESLQFGRDAADFILPRAKIKHRLLVKRLVEDIPEAWHVIG